MTNKKIKGITIQYEGDTTKLETALGNIDKAGRKARQEMTEVNRALKEAPESAVLWQQKQELLNKALANSKEKLDLLEKSQEQVTKQFKEGQIGEEQYRAYQRELESARASTEKLGEQVTDTDKHIKELGEASEDTSKDVEQMGTAAETSSEGFTILKGAVAHLAADGFEKLMTAAKEAWEEIDEGYDTIVTKTGATGEKLENLKAVADNVYKALPVEMNIVGEAAGEITTRFSVQDDELEALTEHFVQYATINKTSVAPSVKNVAGIMKAFGEDTEKTGDVLGVLTSVSQRTGKEVSSLESELYSNSATFKEMNLDIRQSAELLGQFEANGVDTSTALAGLKKAQQNATAEGKTMTEALSGTIKRIKEAETETEALQIATDLFGKKGAAAMTQAIREERFSVDDLIQGYEGMGDVVKNTYEATLDAPDKVKVMLNNVKLELAALAENYLPKVEKYLDKGIEALPKIEKSAKVILPVVEGIGIAAASWKIATIARDGVKAFEALTGAAKLTEDQMRAVQSTAQLAEGAAMVAVGFIVTEVYSVVKKAHDEYVPAVKRINQEISDSLSGTNDKIKDIGKSLDDVQDTFSKSANNADYEAEKVKSLWEELEKLADASGNVKDKDKLRADYILGELNEALGTEYKRTGDQIEGYQTLAKEIDNVIEKKKAEAYFDSYQGSLSTMVQNENDIRESYLEAYAKEQDALKSYRENYKKLTGRELAASDDEIREQLQKTVTDYEALPTRTVKNVAQNDMYRAAVQLLGTDEQEGLISQRSALEAQYKEVKEYFDKYESAENAFADGEYDRVIKILAAQKDADKEKLASAREWNKEAQKAYEDSITKVSAAFELASNSNATLLQKDADELINTLTESATLGMRAGAQKSEVLSKTFRDQVQKILDKGFDISKLTAWASESGVDVGDVFGEDYTKVVQAQLDAGYDINNLLIWGINSGIDVGTLFTDEFTSKYQSQLNSGFDVSLLLEWAAENGYSAGEVFGSNFKAVMTRYIYATNDLINENSINSESDARYLREKGVVSWSHNATGNFLNIGHEGIIAEAGPELIQVMNGGVKVTPLTRNARNTPVSEQAGSQKIIYENISIYATVSSDYDVRLLGERLAAEKKSIEESKGL